MTASNLRATSANFVPETTGSDGERYEVRVGVGVGLGLGLGLGVRIGVGVGVRS